MLYLHMMSDHKAQVNTIGKAKKKKKKKSLDKVAKRGSFRQSG